MQIDEFEIHGLMKAIGWDHRLFFAIPTRVVTVVPKQVPGFSIVWYFPLRSPGHRNISSCFFSRTSSSHHGWPWLVEPLTEDSRPQKQLDSTQGGLRPTVTQVVTPVVGGTSPVPSGVSPFAKP